MNTKLVYILTSTNDDYYAEETMLSMYSARFHNPDAVICLLVDDETRKGLTGTRSKIWKHVDEVHEISVSPSYTNKQKSRILKTSVRNEIEGPMLFIDSDTIVCGDLSSLDSLEMEIGAVLDMHTPVSNWSPDTLATINGRLAKLGGAITPDVPFFNSGVIYLKDTELTRSFYKTWQSYYLQSMKQGLNTDQPGLYMTNLKYNAIREMPAAYNCQIIKQVYAFPRIIHYFSTQVSSNASFAVRIPLLNDELLKRVKEEDEIPEDIQNLIRDPQKLLDAPLIEYSDLFQTSGFIVMQKFYNSSDRTQKRQFAFLNWLAKWMNRFDQHVLKKK